MSKTKTKGWKVKMVGTYFMAGKDNEEKDYTVEGIIPACEKGWVLSFVKARYLKRWIKEQLGVTPTHIYRYEPVKIEEVEITSDIDGVSIDEMDWDQLQNLATEFTLLGVPTIRQGSLKDAQHKAKQAYLENVKEIDLSKEEDVFVRMHGGKVIVDLKDTPVESDLKDKTSAPSMSKISLKQKLKAEKAEKSEKVDMVAGDEKKAGAVSLK